MALRKLCQPRDGMCLRRCWLSSDSSGHCAPKSFSPPVSHKQNHTFCISSQPRCMLPHRKGYSALPTCVQHDSKQEKGCAGLSGFMCMRLMCNLVCGRNQFTEDNCSFPRGEEEAMKGNERLSLHHCTQLALTGTMIISKWIQLWGCYSHTSPLFMSSYGHSYLASKSR